MDGLENTLEKRQKVKELVEKRIKQAKQRKIWDKAWYVSEVLGTKISKSFSFINKNIEISNNEDFQKDYYPPTHHISIYKFKYDKSWMDGEPLKELVFKADGSFGNVVDEIKTYVPGNWEKELNTLYKKALKKPEEDKKAEEQKYKKDNKDNWGIDFNEL